MHNQLLSKKHLLSKAIAVALMGGVIAPVSAAEQNKEETIEVIEVSGLRQSLVSSIAIKQDSTSFVEAISAEDIGKLPDVSIAESLSRLPGLAGQRVNGRAQVISIRGMGPDFTTTLLNGRQQASSGDNRAPEFDQYPSELINGAVVYKSADASVVGMGLAGTVDLQTIRPLAHGERNIVLNVRGETNSIDTPNKDMSDTGIRGSFSYIDQFANDTIGIALGFSHTDTPSLAQRTKGWWWDTQGEDAVGEGNSDALVLQGQEVVGVSRNQVRNGFLGVFEWQPNDDSHTILDTYYSKFDQDETTRGVYWFSTANTGDGTVFNDTNFVDFGGTKTLQSGIATNLHPVLRNDSNTRDDELFAIGLNNETLYGNWVISTDLSYSSSERKEQVAETYAGLGEPTNIGFDIVQEGFNQYTIGTDYTDASTIELSDPAPWGGWGHDGTIRHPEVKETVKTFSIKGDYDLAETAIGEVFSSAVVGFDYTERSKEKDVTENELMLKNDRAPTTVDAQYLVDAVDLSFAGIPGSISYNTDAVIANYYDLVAIDGEDHWNKAWSVDEEVTTLFVKLVIDTEVFGLPLTGDLGTQYIRTDQGATGFTLADDPNSDLPILVDRSDSHSYTDILPSVNLKLEIADNQYVRLAAGKYMARARMDDMRATLSAGVGVDQTWSGGGGNTKLEPWRADAIDLGYEFYFSSASYFGLSYFYKDLESYIYNDQVLFDFTGLPNESGFTPISNIGTMSQPTNGEGGTVDGTELSFVLDGELLNEYLTGFGIVGSFSWTDSDIQPDGPESSTSLPGLSDKVRSLTAYYERDGFSFRISQRYRSAFRGEVPQLFANRGFSEISADEQIDAQISYEPQSGALEGTTFLFQVNNLTNSPYETNLGTQLENGAHLPEFYEEYGRQFLFGVNYKF